MNLQNFKGQKKQIQRPTNQPTIQQGFFSNPLRQQQQQQQQQQRIPQIFRGSQIPANQYNNSSANQGKQFQGQSQKTEFLERKKQEYEIHAMEQRERQEQMKKQQEQQKFSNMFSQMERMNNNNNHQQQRQQQQIPHQSKNDFGELAALIVDEPQDNQRASRDFSNPFNKKSTTINGNIQPSTTNDIINKYTDNNNNGLKRSFGGLNDGSSIVQNLDCMKKQKKQEDQSWENIDKKENTKINVNSIMDQFQLKTNEQQPKQDDIMIIDSEQDLDQKNSKKNTNNNNQNSDEKIGFKIKKKNSQSAITDFFKNKNQPKDNNNNNNNGLNKRSLHIFQQNKQGGAQLLATQALQPQGSLSANLKTMKEHNIIKNNKNDNKSNQKIKGSEGPYNKKFHSSNQVLNDIFNKTEEERQQDKLNKYKSFEEERKRKKLEKDKNQLRKLMEQEKEMREKEIRDKQRRHKMLQEKKRRTNFANMVKMEDNNNNNEIEVDNHQIKKKNNAGGGTGSDQKKVEHQSFFEKDYEKAYPKSQMEKQMDEIYFSGGYSSFEDRTNYNALIRHLLQRDYADEQSLNQESKQIPNKFFSYKEYNIIFQYLFVNECVAKFYSTIQQFKKSTNFSLGQPCHIKLKSTDRNPEGFTLFDVGIGHKKGGKFLNKQKQQDRLNSNRDLESGEFEDYEIQEQIQYEFDLNYQKNYIMLLSSEKEIDLEKMSNKKFRDKDGKFGFLFLGWLVPPDSKAIDEPIRVKTEVDGNLFQSLCVTGVINCYIYPLEKISTFIREYLAIKNMHFQEDLMRILVQPEVLIEERFQHVVQQPQVMEKFFSRTKSMYNETQFKIIREICLTKSGLSMVQGPPGTGKTHTLIGLVSGLFYYQKNAEEGGQRQKIMICAPSNTAIDEVIERIQTQGLISYDGSRQHVNIVRVGILDGNASQVVKSTCLEYQSQQRLNGILGAQNLSTATDLKQDIADLNDRLMKLGKIRCADVAAEQENLKEINRITEIRRQKYGELNKTKGVKIQQKKKYNEIMDAILLNADIICCTLNSSATDKLNRFRNEIDVLIIDEAAQATEPNTLIPLQYGPKKVVLVGDPKQLPATTFSSDSQVTKYNRSMFERILDNEVPPYFLDIQYRMHPDIRSFPSDMFYDDKLQDADFIENRKMPKFLEELKDKNIYFFDIKYSRQKMVDKSYENEYEAYMIVKFLKHFIEKMKQANQNVRNIQDSIGIISPYKQQTKKLKKIIKENLSQQHNLIKNQVLINTVDSFQGQEKDLILFSTVRAAYNTEKYSENLIGFLSDERRLNVALTRARHGLLIFGNSDTLSSDDNWSKLIYFLAQCQRYIKVNTTQEGKELKNQFIKDKIPQNLREYEPKQWNKKKKAIVDVLNINDFQENEDQNNNNKDQDNVIEEEEEQEEVGSVQILDRVIKKKTQNQSKSTSHVNLESEDIGSKSGLDFDFKMPNYEDEQISSESSNSGKLQFNFNKKMENDKNNKKDKKDINKRIKKKTGFDDMKFGNRGKNEEKEDNFGGLKNFMTDINYSEEKQKKNNNSISGSDQKKDDFGGFKVKKKSNISSENNLNKMGNLDIEDAMEKNKINNNQIISGAMGLEGLLNGDFENQYNQMK